MHEFSSSGIAGGIGMFTNDDRAGNRQPGSS